jgi:hypothetical protein
MKTKPRKQNFNKKLILLLSLVLITVFCPLKLYAPPLCLGCFWMLLPRYAIQFNADSSIKQSLVLPYSIELSTNWQMSEKKFGWSHVIEGAYTLVFNDSDWIRLGYEPRYFFYTPIKSNPYYLNIGVMAGGYTSIKQINAPTTSIDAGCYTGLSLSLMMANAMGIKLENYVKYDMNHQRFSGFSIGIGFQSTGGIGMMIKEQIEYRKRKKRSSNLTSSP